MWHRLAQYGVFRSQRPIARRSPGLLGLSRQVAIDYGPQKIRSNVVLPGAFRSEMFDRRLEETARAAGISVEERLNAMAAPSPLKRIRLPVGDCRTVRLPGQ